MRLRQDQMSNEERLDALFSYRKPDRVPIGTLRLEEFAALNSGHPKPVNYTDPEKSFHSQVQTAKKYGWDNIPLSLSLVIHGTLNFGGEVKLPESDYQSGITAKTYPVQNEEDVAKLKLPDRRTAGFIPRAREFARLQQKHGMPIWFCTRSPFTEAANICGLNQFCRWLVKKPELCHTLIKLMLAHTFEVLEDWVAEFGTERVIYYMAAPSESNQVISPRDFARFALPYHTQLHDRLRAMGIKRFAYHICGEQSSNLPYLSELSPWPHPAILSFGHEVDLEVAAKYFPKDIIYGNIEPARIQEGTPQQVYELCRATIEKGRKAPGGFILGPGCQLPAATPPLNAFAITRAVNDFGWYE